MYGGVRRVAPRWDARAATCESLATFRLSNGTVTAATVVFPGSFAPPGAAPTANPVFKTLPDFCRATACLTPTSDSDIRIEVWLPASGWNGELQRPAMPATAPWMGCSRPRRSAASIRPSWSASKGTARRA